MAHFFKTLAQGVAVWGIGAILLASSASAAVWRVQPGGSGSGGSWSSPLGSIGEALIAATTGDELWVAEGVYHATVEMKNGVAIYGGFEGNELTRDERNWKAHVTVIDATGLADSAVTGADRALMDGFTITGGSGHRINSILAGPRYYGGGIRCKGSSPTFSNCTITGNTITSHTGLGGGVYCESSAAVFYNCTISENYGDYGGGVFFGSITVGSSAVPDTSTFINCTISDNSSQGGGGIYCNYSSPRFINCAIIGNDARDNIFGPAQGGGIYSSSSNALYRNCIIANNSSEGDSSGICAYERFENIPVHLVNCILKNQGDEIVIPNGSADANAAYCCIEGGYEGEGNISSDPLFVDEAGGDYRLQPGSPCIDAGNPSFYYNDACLPPGQNTPRNDMGIYGGPENCGQPNVESFAPIDLFVDTPYDNTLTIGQAAHFIAWSTGCENLVLTLDGDYTEGIVEIHARQGQPPTRFKYDYSSAQPARAGTGRDLVIPRCGDGPWYVMLYCTHLTTAQTAYTLESACASLEVLSVSPRVVSNGWPASVMLHGIGFSNATTVQLANPYKTFLTARKVTLLDATTLEAEFDFRLVSPSQYDIRVREDYQTATLPGALTVLQSQGPKFTASIVGPSPIRANWTYGMIVRYANTGDAPMTAPLLILSSTSGTPTSLGGDSLFDNSPKWALGIARKGEAGILAPGASGSFPVYFSGDFLCQFALFAGDDLAASLSWDVPEWPTWGDYNQALAEVANRLNRRGTPVYSVEALENFARAERAGENVGAICGRVRGQSSPVRLPNARVYAIGDSLTGGALTDFAGRFVIENLAPGDYTLALEGYSTSSPVHVTVPAGGDVYGLELMVQADPSALALTVNTSAPAVPPAAARPAEPRVFYDDYFPIQVYSYDPNEKIGPEGTGAPDYSASMTEPLRYVAYFENQATATAAVQTLTIGDRLASEIDWTSFELEAVSFGGRVFPVEPGLNLYSTRVTVDLWTYDGSSWITQGEAWVDIEASVDMATGLATWRLTTLDPLTGFPPADPYTGFLPPNDASGRGAGSVSFSALPKGSLSSGTAIANSAEIVFDSNEPIVTNTWTNTMVEALPGAIVNVYPPNGSIGVPTDSYLDWENTPGAVTYDLYLWKEGQARPSTPTAAALTASSYLPGAPLEESEEYRWQVIAVNGAGQTIGDEWELSTFILGTATSVPPVNWTDYR